MTFQAPFQSVEYGPDEDGFLLEDRPIGNGLILPIRYRGFHTDSCIKTENGWICNDICPVEERYGNKRIKTVETPIKVFKELSKISSLKYKWSVSQQYEVRTFRDGRSFKVRGQSVRAQSFDEGYCTTRFKAKRAIVNTVEKHMLNG